MQWNYDDFRVGHTGEVPSRYVCEAPRQRDSRMSITTIGPTYLPVDSKSTYRIVPVMYIDSHSIIAENRLESRDSLRRWILAAAASSSTQRLMEMVCFGFQCQVVCRIPWVFSPPILATNTRGYVERTVIWNVTVHQIINPLRSLDEVWNPESKIGEESHQPTVKIATVWRLSDR